MEFLPLPRRSQVMRAHKQGGGRIAAVLPIHYPRALLRAFDILPVEMWGPPRLDAGAGAAHLQPYVCSIVRNALAFIQSAHMDDVDLILVPHACDSLQGLGSLLLDFVRPARPVFPLYIPRGKRASDIDFLADELRSLYRQLEQVGQCSPSHADLDASIQREETADKLLSELHQRRKQLALTQVELYRLIRSREYLPAETFTELTQAALSCAPQSPQEGIPLVLSGIVPEPMSLFESIAAMGGWIAADDLACCGRRLYPPGASSDPFQRMAESILQAPPDPTRGSSIHDRLEHLVRLTQATGARGVIFYDVKFCEPELFDLPILRKGLHDAGIPSLIIELDLNDPLSNQVLTRIEAFLEMIR